MTEIEKCPDCNGGSGDFRSSHMVACSRCGWNIFGEIERLRSLLREPTTAMINAMSKPIGDLKEEQELKPGWVNRREKYRIRWRAGADVALGSLREHRVKPE